MAQVWIGEVGTITPDLVESMAALVGQLSSSAQAPTRDDLEQIIRSPATILLAARQSDHVVGMLTLVIYRIPTGLCGVIEDVVVDEAHRGGGIAEALTREALTRAQAVGVKAVDLTSRPSRAAANRLYVKLGFHRRETNVYRYSFRV